MKSNKSRKSLKSSNLAGTAAWAFVRWSLPFVVVLSTWTTFLPALQNGFVDWDDGKTLLENPHYRGLGWSQLRWMFGTFHMGHYQPLSWMTLGMDYLVWGMNPFGYHLTSLVLHVANGVGFYFVCRRLLVMVFPLSAERQALAVNLAGALAALLFAVHPLRVESVAWATERRDVLSGLFFLACIDFYLRAQQTSGDQSRRRWLIAAVIAHALSLLSKATAMTIPIVLLLLDVYPLRRLPESISAWFKPATRTVLREKLPFLILAIIFGLVALAAQQETGALRQVQQYFFSYRVAQAFYGIGFYLWKTFLPIRLSPLYELPFDFDAWMPLFILSAAAVLLLSIALYLLRERWPALLACWGYYLVLVSPVLGIAQSGPQLVADRYSYLSCLSWAVLAGGLFFKYSQSGNAPEVRQLRVVVFPAAAMIIVAVLGVLTWNQTRVWQDTKTLWQYVLQVAPESGIAHFNLGRIYESEGKLAVAQDSYRHAVSINPTYSEAHYNLARLLVKRGDQIRAIYHYREALRFKPNDAEARNNLGLLLAMRGEIEASLAELQKAIDADPKYVQAFFNMARVLAGQNDLVNAAAKYEEAVKLSPRQAEIHFGLGNVLALQGDWGAATKHLRQAIELKADYVEAHVALARSLAAQGRTDEAEQSYRAALKLLKSQSATPAVEPLRTR